MRIDSHAADGFVPRCKRQQRLHAALQLPTRRQRRRNTDWRVLSVSLLPSDRTAGHVRLHVSGQRSTARSSANQSTPGPNHWNPMSAALAIGLYAKAPVHDLSGAGGAPRSELD